MSAPLPPLVAGLVGPIGAGKDTAAAYLQEHYVFTAIAFADPVRDMLGALIGHVGVGGEWLTERALKEHPMPVIGRSYRQLARSLGGQWGRAHVRHDLWVRIAAHQAEQALARGENVLLTDVRHLNEARWLRSLGGQLVAIQRDGCEFAIAEHDSEAEASLLECEHSVTNHSTAAHLYDQLDLVVERLRTPTAGADA